MSIDTQIIPPGVAASLVAVCERHRVARLRLFGSVVRGEPTDASDIDLLVDYRDDFVPDLFEVFDLSEGLSEVFGGRPVDLGRESSLHWYLKPRILKEARTIYEA
ncbi:MAG TPA: nucleotidyltransferase domain-containing protein [Tepidisphaeraceae bacterium]|jgi:hypothetical protein